MKFKQAYFLGSVLVQMFVITSLVTSSPLLNTPVIEEGTLPWGNVMTWALFILFPLNFLLIRKNRPIPVVPKRFYTTAVLTSAVMGLLWLPVSYGLSGNWGASFEGGGANQKIWETYTYLTPTLPFIGYFGMRVLSVFFKIKPKA